MQRTDRETTGAAQGDQRPRRPYEPPRIVRRQQVLASTLVSGEQCVFDPPNPDGSCP